MHSASLKGHVVIVTGAGQGIGRAEATEFARHGARVLVNDIRRDDADAVVAAIRERGGEAEASYDSVTTADGGADIVRHAIDAFGTVDALVNNAGFLRPGRFEDLTFSDIDDIIDVHLKAAFYVTQPVWRIMKAKGYGRVVMTGSSAGLFSQGANSNYCAAKAGVFGLARALAYEGSDHGIAVNVVLPFAATTISTRNPIPGVAQQRERHGAVYDGLVSERRTTESVAPLVALLSSPDCTVTGETFSACAGRYARVFVGVGRGWLAHDLSDLTAERLHDHLAEIRRVEPFNEPRTMFDEVAEVVQRLTTLHTG